MKFLNYTQTNNFFRCTLHSRCEMVKITTNFLTFPANLSKNHVSSVAHIIASALITIINHKPFPLILLNAPHTIPIYTRNVLTFL